MQLLNRVTPTGSLVSAPGTRGLLMGNRGTLGSRQYELAQPHKNGKPWIACVLKDKNGFAIPDSGQAYTKLFFLDEVTAFAAGHRPCGQCQNKRYRLLVETWKQACGIKTGTLDEHLQAERCDEHAGGKKPLVLRRLSSLPDGTMVALVRDGQPYLLHSGMLFPWSVSGYGQPVTAAVASEVQVLTPLSIVKTFQAGFPLPLNVESTVHPSALAYLE